MDAPQASNNPNLVQASLPVNPDDSARPNTDGSSNDVNNPAGSQEVNSVLAQQLEKANADKQQLLAQGQADRLRILQLEEKLATGLYFSEITQK